MATINNNSYNSTITKLEAIADGTRKHKVDAKIAAVLDEAYYRTAKTDLEAARQKYLELETATRKAYDEFSLKYDSSTEKLSADTRILKGIFGRSAEDLKDFGIDPEKATQGKKVASKAKV